MSSVKNYAQCTHTVADKLIKAFDKGLMAACQIVFLTPPLAYKSKLASLIPKHHEFHVMCGPA